MFYLYDHDDGNYSPSSQSSSLMQQIIIDLLS